jgi:hypothetical protein
LREREREKRGRRLNVLEKVKKYFQKHLDNKKESTTFAVRFRKGV